MASNPNFPVSGASRSNPLQEKPEITDHVGNKPLLANMFKLTGIQSLVREHPHNHQEGGNLLMADLQRTERGVHIPVVCTGSELDDQTEFYLELDERHEATTFRCEVGGNHYYLCTEGDKVFLQKLVAYHPNDEKFMFEIKSVSAKYMNIKSIKTGMYLASNEEGKAFMKEVKTTQDRQTWFYLIDKSESERVSNTGTLYSCNFDCTSISFSVTYPTAEVEAC